MRACMCNLLLTSEAYRAVESCRRLSSFARLFNVRELKFRAVWIRFCSWCAQKGSYSPSSCVWHRPADKFLYSPKLLAEEYIDTVGRNCTLNNPLVSLSGSERVSRYAMNEPENQILKSEIFKEKEHDHVTFFYLNYGELRKRRSSVLGFLNDS